MITTILEQTFFTNHLSSRSVVLDLGANQGAFGAEVARRYGAMVHLVEPSEALYGRLPSGSRILTHNCALGAVDGSVDFYLSEDPESSSLLPARSSNHDSRVGLGGGPAPTSVPGLTLSGFLKQQGLQYVDLVKVDIEGAESLMFASADLSILTRVGQFTVEFHDFVGLLTAVEIDRVVEKLSSAGFYPIKFSLDNRNWLFVNRERSGISRVELASTRYGLKYVRGALRKAGLIRVEYPQAVA